jgi:hypothetical protein
VISTIIHFPLIKIEQWLPNQLQAVLKQMMETQKFCEHESGVEDIIDLVEVQSKTLQKEVEKYCEEQEVKDD